MSDSVRSGRPLHFGFTNIGQKSSGRSRSACNAHNENRVRNSIIATQKKSVVHGNNFKVNSTRFEYCKYVGNTAIVAILEFASLTSITEIAVGLLLTRCRQIRHISKTLKPITDFEMSEISSSATTILLQKY